MTRWIALFLMVAAPAWAGEGLRQAYQRPDTIPFPADNPYSAVKAALGKMLFFDPRLSRDKNLNCASCHNPSFGWEVPLAKPVGAQATPLRRHAPTVLNTAWVTSFFWDGRAASLEDQAPGPIQNRVEMNLPLAMAVQRLQKVQGYRYWFSKAFPEVGLTRKTIVQALATYERTLVSTEAPFDRWVKGDENAITASAKRGFRLFNGKARCAACHTGWNLTDNRFHDVGLPDTGDLGRFEITGKPSDRHAFKTPSLRNLTQRAPYMHDGSLHTLQAVVAHYVSGGVQRDTLSPLMKPVPLSAREQQDLIDFLKTLTGPDMVVSLPVLPN